MKSLKLVGLVAFAAGALSSSAANEAYFVQYLQSTGDQVVLTDYTPTSNTVIEVKVAQLASSQTHCVFCARGNSTSTHTFTVFHISNAGWRSDYYNNTTSASVPNTEGEPCVLRCSGSEFNVNGEKKQDRTPQNFTADNRLSLFGSYTANPGALSVDTSFGNLAKIRFYYLKAWEPDASGNLELKLDLRPCVSTDGRAGLKDSVSGTTWPQGRPQGTKIAVNPTGDNFGYGVVLTTSGSAVLTNCVVENVAVPNWRGGSVSTRCGCRDLQQPQRPRDGLPRPQLQRQHRPRRRRLCLLRNASQHGRPQRREEGAGGAQGL